MLHYVTYNLLNRFVQYWKIQVLQNQNTLTLFRHFLEKIWEFLVTSIIFLFCNSFFLFYLFREKPIVIILNLYVFFSAGNAKINITKHEISTNIFSHLTWDRCRRPEKNVIYIIHGNLLIATKYFTQISYKNILSIWFQFFYIWDEM